MSKLNLLQLQDSEEGFQDYPWVPETVQGNTLQREHRPFRRDFRQNYG